MNGARSTYMRRGYLLTALAAAVLLAASSGTALAQTATIDSVSLSPTTVMEGGEATATVRFTLTAGTTDAAAVPNLAVGFAFDVSAPGFASSPRATNAVVANFTGITDDETASQEFVSVAALRAGRSRTYTATRTFRVNHDLDAENGQFKLGATLADWEGQTVTPVDATAATYTIQDDETQTYTLSLDPQARGRLTEGAAAVTNVSLSADPARTAAGTVPTFTLALENPADAAIYTLTPGITPANLAVGSGTPAVLAGGIATDSTAGTILALEDKNRDDDIVKLVLYSGSVGSASKVEELPVPVTDIHKLPPSDKITAMAKDAALNGEDVAEIVEGGDPVYLTITVDRGTVATNNATTTEDLRVDISASSGQGGDVEVEPTRVDLPPANARGMSVTDVDIMLTALSDEDVGAEDLVLNLTVSGGPGSPAGTSTGTFTIAIVDDTEKKIESKGQSGEYPPEVAAALEAGKGEDGMLNPGEMVQIMTSDLFEVAKGYTASYGVSVEGDAVSASASGEMVTINAEKAGESVVMITGTARMPGSSFEVSQDVSNIAEVKFAVEVVDEPLMITLEMPGNVMDGNIVEGSSYEIGVMANRMVTEAEGSVEVMIMRDRAASDADDSDFTVSSATIMAGYDSATAELMVTEDMEPDSGTNDNMGEQLVLYGMAGEMETNSLTFTIWDQAVPSLPLIGQLLLALFLMAGGARLYRRRQG